MIGIYKIVSPSNKVYIGQSLDISRRFQDYRNLQNCKGQSRLYSSFLKYGVENHVFEIIEECTFEELNTRERFWQEYYNVISKTGLNCLLVKTDEKSRKVSLETRQKIGEKSKGRTKSPETIAKLKASLTGKKRDEAFCKKMSRINKGKIVSDETKLKQRNNNLGKKLSQFTKDKVREASFKKEYTLLLNLDTGIYYNSICELARALDWIECWKLNYVLTNKKSKMKLKNIIYV